MTHRTEFRNPIVVLHRRRTSARSAGPSYVRSVHDAVLANLIVVGFGPGGASDILARLIGQSLSDRLGKPFIIENRPGAASNIAAEAVVRSPGDGYTLLLMTSGNAMNVSLYERLNFDLLGDIAPVATIAFNPGVMEVSPRFPAKTVPEFIAYARANPGGSLWRHPAAALPRTFGGS